MIEYLKIVLCVVFFVVELMVFIVGLSTVGKSKEGKGYGYFFLAVVLGVCVQQVLIIKHLLEAI